MDVLQKPERQVSQTPIRMKNDRVRFSRLILRAKSNDESQSFTPVFLSKKKKKKRKKNGRKKKRNLQCCKYEILTCIAFQDLRESRRRSSSSRSPSVRTNCVLHFPHLPISEIPTAKTHLLCLSTCINSRKKPYIFLVLVLYSPTGSVQHKCTKHVLSSPLHSIYIHFALSRRTGKIKMSEQGIRRRRLCRSHEQSKYIYTYIPTYHPIQYNTIQYYYAYNYSI